MLIKEIEIEVNPKAKQNVFLSSVVLSARKAINHAERKLPVISIKYAPLRKKSQCKRIYMLRDLNVVV